MPGNIQSLLIGSEAVVHIMFDSSLLAVCWIGSTVLSIGIKIDTSISLIGLDSSLSNSADEIHFNMQLVF